MVSRFLALCFLVTVGSAGAQDVRHEPGVDVRHFYIGERMEAVPTLIEGQTPNLNTLEPTVDLIDFPLEDYFYTEVRARLEVTQPGLYAFRLFSDDGSVFCLDDRVLIDHDGLHPGGEPKAGERELEPGHYELLIQHFENRGEARLSLEWKPPGAEAFGLVPSEALSTPAGVVRVTAPGQKRIVSPFGVSPTPGDVQPLDAVHPAYTLARARPADFEPRVAGMAVLADGRLAVSTWDQVGGVYLLDGVGGDDPDAITVKRIAAGLAEPLGLAVIPGEAGRERVFALQKQELTELIDHDGNDVIDEYRTVCNAWPVSDNFHEFAFGLAHKDGKLYGALAIAIDPGGKSAEPQKPQRGRIIEIDPDSGDHRFIGRGLRTPNTVGIGVDGELFVCDNQGDWLPSSKLLLVEEGAFWDSRAALPDDWQEQPRTPPVIWLPQNEIGNSPSQPGVFPEHSPFPGQMLHGEVTHGGLKRSFIETIDGRYQGAVFRFTQGLEAGVNRFVFAPNGDVYVGGIGTRGNWSHRDRQFGLERLRFNGETAFEMRAVRAKTNGMEIEFTQPLPEGLGADAGVYLVQQWRYEPTEQYGGPKLDQAVMAVRSATVSNDRTRVFLEIAGLKPEHVVYLRLNREHFRDLDGRALWSTEAWYTLNAIPTDRPGEAGEPPTELAARPNFEPLTPDQRAQGWRHLFDGRSPRGWRGYQRDDFPASGWTVEDGTLTHHAGGGGGNILFDEVFGDFELSLEWRIARGSNSGIFYRVSETPGQAVWHTGPEMQVLDDRFHPDGREPLTSAGALYGLLPADGKELVPVGEWNHVRLVARGTKIEHWLNGLCVVAYDMDRPSFRELVDGSKFASLPGFARQREGYIVLQDHGDRVWYRNIRLRPLD